MRVKYLASVTFAVLLMLALGHSAQAIMMHDAAQGDPAWQQEYLLLGQQYDSVGVLYGKNETGWHTLGSGVVFGDGTHVIGAAHSALSNYNATYPEYAFITGNNLTDDYWGMFYTSVVSVIPSFTGIETSPDMAIWTFASAIPNVTPATLYTGNDTALLGSVVDMVGFGKSGYPSTGDILPMGTKRGSQDVMYELGSIVFGAAPDQLIMDFDFPGGLNYQHLGGCIWGGDSGGGVFTSDRKLAGIIGWNYGGPEYGASGATSVSQHLDWINSVIGVPEPSTAILLIAATASLAYRRRRAS